MPSSRCNSHKEFELHRSKPLPEFHCHLRHWLENLDFVRTANIYKMENRQNSVCWASNQARIYFYFFILNTPFRIAKQIQITIKYGYLCIKISDVTSPEMINDLP